MRFIIGFLLLSWILCSCSTDAVTIPPEPEACPDNQIFFITVSPGLTPAFTWSPQCHVAYLYVLQPPNDTMWVISGNNSNRIPSGTRYGELPRGAKLFLGPKPLQSGVHYTMSVWRGRSFGQGTDTVFTLVSVHGADFTP